MSDEELIREELEKTASLISGARRLMAEGRHVDLSAMEDRVRAITQAITAAAPKVAAGYRDHLEALMQALEVLETDLQSHHEALQDGLSAIRQREAHDAYKPKK
ncbi:hypothetical protein [Magnetovibrio blakemorei]|uniref:Uncharacterized protein n=1 Tax=Magnetovibrio blakemorei TaxID=28181 RepID=A0A1E5QAH1_9PROT|nr:hypothetical protein [Magnetovibrio blakemorei]OEJ68707.1 hypothetical protein BEN30_05720 [Magnetovibrio blakemorei]